MIQRSYGTECHVDSHREQRLSEIIDSWLRNKDWLSILPVPWHQSILWHCLCGIKIFYRLLVVSCTVVDSTQRQSQSPRSCASILISINIIFILLSVTIIPRGLLRHYKVAMKSVHVMENQQLSCRVVIQHWSVASRQKFPETKTNSYY